MLMTQEVTRLQRERQGLEQQIADLFAFYAKQKQAGKVSIRKVAELNAHSYLVFVGTGNRWGTYANTSAADDPVYAECRSRSDAAYAVALPATSPKSYA